MTSSNPHRVRQLLDRIARVAASEEWTDDLNPAQRAALAYLARANRFSRAPSNIADYLCTTRGTASQTLKALERKGFVVPARAASDKRSISYEVTEKGRSAVEASSEVDDAIAALPPGDAAALERSLEETLLRALAKRGYREFGVCRTCRYHRREKAGRTCLLLNTSLSDADSDLLCHEHSLAS